VETRLWELRWGTFQRQHSFCNICLWPPPWRFNRRIGEFKIIRSG
jgi:hypothetical protein